MKAYQVGDILNTAAFGRVEVNDIFTSSITQKVVYEVKDCGMLRAVFLCYQKDLEDNDGLEDNAEGK